MYRITIPLEVFLFKPMPRVSLRSHSRNGFSLVETLVVITITLILGTLSAMMVPSLMSAQTIAQASSDISQVLDDARSYAIANHTYVFVGFEEVNASNQPNASNQTLVSSSSGGRVAVLVVAAKDGSNNYASASPYFNSANLTALSKVRFINSVHMADFSSLSASSGPMAARAQIITANSLGANATTGGTALFTWPLGASASNAEYSFYTSEVIVFDQEGLAGVVNSTTYTASGYAAPTSSWIEIGLQLTHGTAIPTAPTNIATGQLASIQLDGVTGANRVFRP
jgi:prepilin-type N-terminal cleavage/methylation domain-containing protein